VILAGGLATRYGGRPKGLETVDGRRMIDRVADALRQAADDLLLIANDPSASGWLPSVPAVPDVIPGTGGLGGLHAALTRTGTPVLVVAWDMPFVPAALLAALRALGDEGYDAAVPVSDSPRGLEPLCAYYAPACVSPIERHLAQGDRQMISFYDDIRLARLDAQAVRRFGDPARMFLNVNEPADLARAERLDKGDRA
jgi:molybdopterin-guanine dinucleotide biosynthesis protein A